MFRWWRKETTKKKGGGGVVLGGLLWGDFFAFFGRFFFFSFGGCCRETHRLFFVYFRPRGLLGASGTKIARPWLLEGDFVASSLWPSLGQVTCTGQPPHRRGRVSPDKRMPPCPGGGLTPTLLQPHPNPPTWVGWVPGGRWGKAKHAGVFSPFCAPLVSCTDSWQHWHSKMRLTRTYNYFATYLYTAAVAVVTEMLELLRKKIATNIYIRFMRVTITLNQSCAQYPLSWFHSAWGRSLRAKPGSDGLSGR